LRNNFIVTFFIQQQLPHLTSLFHQYHYRLLSERKQIAGLSAGVELIGIGNDE